MSDVTRADGPSGELQDLAAWIACLGDARTTETYARWLSIAGLEIAVVEQHDGPLKEMVRSIGARLRAA